MSFFHRNNNRQNQDPAHAQRRGFFGRFGGQRNNQQAAYPNGNAYPTPYGNTYTNTTTTYGVNHPQGFYRDPYYEGSTRSDWDHYAVRHEEALIGDPLPIMNNGLNLAARQYQGNNYGAQPYGPGPLGNGPLNHGYDDTHYNKRHPVPNNFDRHGNPLIGPVTANGPLAGNYSSGTVVERTLLQGPGRRTRTGWVDDNAGPGQWGSTAWGSEPLYGVNNGWGNTPLFGYRDARDVATPLLPDNPWTHNELGRDYSDAYRRGTLAYSSVNNAFQGAPITENYSTYGPNGELIQGTRTRVIREEIVPTVGALGQKSTTSTTTVVKDEIIPIVDNGLQHPISVQNGTLVKDTITPLGNGSTLITETQQPVTVLTQ